uniref:Secreted protein n=1 Tax=Echinococcus canadensis TaxID=519352 RepID=A0A915EY55_9CEST
KYLHGDPKLDFFALPTNTTFVYHSQTLCPSNIDKATEQHFERMKFSCKQTHPCTFEGVDCTLMKSMMDFKTPCYHTPENLCMKVVKFTPNTLKIFDSEYKRIVRKQRVVLAGYDCFLCVIELSSILRHNSKIKAELRAIMTNLSSDQTFGLLIDKDVKRKEESRTNFFLDFVQKLGFVNDSPLMSAPMNWGLWCLQGGIAELTNSRDILTGVCQDVIRRRMQARGPQLAARSREVPDFPKWFRITAS